MTTYSLNHCERCHTWLVIDEIALCDACANEVANMGLSDPSADTNKASAQPEGQAAPGTKRGEAASRLGKNSKSTLASAASSGLPGMGTAASPPNYDRATWERMRDEISKLKGGKATRERLEQLMKGAFERYDNAGRGLPNTVANQMTVPGPSHKNLGRHGRNVEWLSDHTTDVLACVYNAICDQDEMANSVTEYPWVVDHGVISSIKLPAGSVTSIDKQQFEDALSDLELIGMIEMSYDRRSMRLLRGESFRMWRDESFKRGADLETMGSLRVQVQERAKEFHDQGRREADPTPWSYNGATEEALLAVEAMSPNNAKVKLGVHKDGSRVYSIKEIAKHRPFQVTFDAAGDPVDDLGVTGWNDPGPMAFTMVKDLLAALVSKIERASEAWLCRGCGEIDPDGMEDGTDWHVVLTEHHDPSTGGHSPDGECLTCPVQVPEQCGPIVKVGGTK